jgi:phenylacetate-coenzyme A ligase PaaK-like adenylate-forming protein
VTNLSRRLFPIIRLRTGDRGRRLREPCACGSVAETFDLLGRSDDMVRAGGADILVSDVDRLCQRFPDALSLMYQLRIGKEGVDDCYELWIESKAPVTESLTKQVEAAYLEIADDLRH